MTERRSDEANSRTPNTDGDANSRQYTMIDSKASNRRSARNEAAVAEQFKKLGYLVEKLDRKASKGRRPDFLISSSAGPQMLCEVKTVDSAFYPRDKKKYGVADVHISTLDPNFIGKFGNIPTDGKKADELLAYAVRQRAELIADRPETADLPLLVALFFDFFAEHLFPYPYSFEPQISGILTIETDVERKKAFAKLSDEEQKRRAKAEFEGNAQVNDDLPPRSTDFVLVHNEAAIRPVPEDFSRLCLPNAYYG
jgi:hypothetical protein